MKFSTVFAAAVLAGVSQAGWANSTVTDIQTTVVTITSCSEDKCHEIPKTTGVVTVCEESTTYTTYCPLTSETTSWVPKPAPCTTITVTECDTESICTSYTTETGYTTVCEESTTYTTWCPIPSSEVVTYWYTCPTPGVTTTYTASELCPSCSEGTEYVTYTKEVPVVTKSESTAAPSTVAPISIYSGAAEKVGVSGLFLGVVGLFLL
ncbi:uncharacterized protein KQ657_003077 [Scheffersomyces spartinae]|uniref:Uncharacterized protein n=1 Tax=Scheffersomyces spartinae TaxID=45513 RepID=A0A9P7V512_9ASCO|nr:uncharacterized protein KQ657_003077 [Scheffersomyces spartinae]KAG7191482.1 hypothetical protein KQ657_003077 [Scheffersomyces spartinae]